MFVILFVIAVCDSVCNSLSIHNQSIFVYSMRFSITLCIYAIDMLCYCRKLL